MSEIKKYIVKKSKEGSVKVGRVYIDMQALKKDYTNLKRRAKNNQVGGYDPKALPGGYISDTIGTLQAWEEYVKTIYPKPLKPLQIKLSFMFWFLSKTPITKMCGQKYALQNSCTLQGGSTFNKYIHVEAADKDNGSPVYHTLKFQDMDQTGLDDLFYDAVNCRILQNILERNTDIKGLHFDSIVAFFLTLYRTDTGKKDITGSFSIGNIIDFMKTDNPLSFFESHTYDSSLIDHCYDVCEGNNKSKEDIKECIEPNIEILYRTRTLKPFNYTLCKCSVVKRVCYSATESKTLEQFIKEIPTFYTIPNMITDLVIQMIKLGKQCCFVHNDCHLRNILLDADRNLVLIDMGRAYFYTNEGEMQIFNRICQAESMSLLEDTAKTYMDLMKSTLSPSNTLLNPISVLKAGGGDRQQQFFLHNMCLFDISTLVFNVLHQCYLVGKTYAPEQIGIPSGFQLDKNWNLPDSKTPTQSESELPFLVKIPTPDYFSGKIVENATVFTLAIYILSIYIHHRYIHEPLIETLRVVLLQNGCYSFAFGPDSNIQKFQFLGSSYQYSRPEDMKQFIIDFYEYESTINQMINTIMRVSQGGCKPTKCKSHP